jgi:hypothetical protein
LTQEGGDLPRPVISLFVQRKRSDREPGGIQLTDSDDLPWTTFPEFSQDWCQLRPEGVGTTVAADCQHGNGLGHWIEDRQEIPYLRLANKSAKQAAVTEAVHITPMGRRLQEMQFHALQVGCERDDEGLISIQSDDFQGGRITGPSFGRPEAKALL